MKDWKPATRHLARYYADGAIATPHYHFLSGLYRFYTVMGEQVGPDFHSIEEAREYAIEACWRML